MKFLELILKNFIAIDNGLIIKLPAQTIDNFI